MSTGLITVVSTCHSLEECRNLVSSVRISGSPEIPIVVLAPELLVAESHLTGDEWAGVSFYPLDTTIEMMSELSEFSSAYVVSIPRANVISLSGIHAATAILDEDQSISEVGGLCSGLRGYVESGAFKQIYADASNDIVIAPIETTRPFWSKAGVFAKTDADYLGGLTVVRREFLSPRHFFDGSILARSLATVNLDNYKVVVFSGLVMTTVSGFSNSKQAADSVESLPDGTYKHWAAKPRFEARILHQGHALRHDDLEKVFFFHDGKVRAVDGAVIGDAIAPGHYYRQEFTAAQLGFGSSVALGQAFLRLESAGNSPSQSLSGPEQDLINLARKLAQLLPKKLVELIVNLIKKLR